MLYKGDGIFPSQIYTDIQRTSDVNKNLEIFFSQNFLGELPTTSERIAHIIHAPFSQPHLARINEDNANHIKPLLKTDGSFIHAYDNNQKIGIPISKVIQNDFLTSISYSNLKKLGTKIDIPKARDLMYGDFQPVQVFSSSYEEGFGLDPKLFLIAFLSELAVERKNIGIKTESNVVIHTDFLYFMSEGDLNEVDDNLKYINKLATELGIRVVIENNELSKNQVFQDAVPWGVDPIDIATKIRGLSNLGVCIDIKHCIVNGLSIQDIKTKIETLKGQGVALVIHSREHFSGKEELKELTNYIFSNAIPIAFEP